MRRILACLVLALLASCVGLGVPRTIHISQARMQAALDERFPLRHRVLEIFELQLAAPQLRMLPQENRLAATLAIQGTNLLDKRGFDGRLVFDFGLRFDGADASVRLVQPRIEALQTGRGMRLDERLQPLAAQIVQTALDGLVLYRVKPAQIEALRAAGFRPGALTVTADGVTLAIEPLP